MPKSPDYYASLGVARNATQEEIKQAYLKAAQRLHPDKNVADGETELFIEVQQAYEALSNPNRRKKYDATLPAEPEQPAAPIKYKITYSRPNLVRTDEPQIIYVLLEIAPPDNKSDEISAPPLNICLVLDRSTSMKGEKMDVLKNATIKVMRNLRSQDIFSVVAFSDRAEILVPASYVSNKSRLESQIHMLQASGATEIFQGLQVAVQETQRHASKERIDHIILLTDGHTYGDEQNCIKLAEKASQQGIGISAMGIGKEWNDLFLDELTNRTGGSSRYISRPEEIHQFLAEKFEALARTLVDDVILEFSLPPGVELDYAFRTRPESGPLPTRDAIHLGSVLQDTTLHVLFEFRINPSTTKQDVIDLLSGSLKLAMAAVPRPIQPIRIKFSRNVKDEAGLEPPPTLILQSLGKLTLYRIQEKAHTEVEQGQYELAAQHMRNLATSLLSQGESSLARTAMIEVDNILQQQAFSADGRKEIKYGTRSLMTSLERE